MEKVVAIFDIGKTNKKFFLLNTTYTIVLEETTVFEEIVDEDNFPCDDITAIIQWIESKIQWLKNQNTFHVAAINCSTYGASFVYVNNNGNIIAPLYNYLKPLQKSIKQHFYAKYGNEEALALETCSPVLDNLNSMFQLFSIKQSKQQVYSNIQYALHLPQYICFLLTNNACSDITSIGCHTMLWHFKKNQYHSFVHQENLIEKLAPLQACATTFTTYWNNSKIEVGIGLHDSSAALIPYLLQFHEPFVLISTGTWCITLNPFNNLPLTTKQLQKDCLCYISYTGKPVKAARLFAGKLHEEVTKIMAEHFNVNEDFYKYLPFSVDALSSEIYSFENAKNLLAYFTTVAEAYHAFMQYIVQLQIQSANLVIEGQSIKRVFVDGGFAKNSIYMNILAKALYPIEVFASSVSQATAVGAALAIHNSWNAENNLPTNIVHLQYYSGVYSTAVRKIFMLCYTIKFD